MKILNKIKGYTLVELLVSMGILSILLLVILRVFVQIVEMRLDAEAESAVAQDSRYVFSRLTYDINRASLITTPSNPGDSSSTLSLVIGGITYTYEIDVDGRLSLYDGTNTNLVTSEGSRVNNAQFTKVGPAAGAQSVKVEMEIVSTTERVQGPASFIVNTTVGTR